MEKRDFDDSGPKDEREKKRKHVKRSLSKDKKTCPTGPNETKHYNSPTISPSPSKIRKISHSSTPVNVEISPVETVTTPHNMTKTNERLVPSQKRKTDKKSPIPKPPPSSQTQGRKPQKEKDAQPKLSKEEIAVKYPVIANEDLIQRFLAVSMTNNQKGRIRQVLKELLHGTTESNLPEVIHNRIQLIMKSTPVLTDTDLRKIRVLYNMLNTAINVQYSILCDKESSEFKAVGENIENTSKKIEKEKGKKENISVIKKISDEKGDVKEKVKGPKRYVVFVGNLPRDVEKDQILEHFSDLQQDIVDVRIPPPKQEKSGIAYVELKNETSFEMALSKHHSMFARKRINVLYTTQQGSKISKAEAKAKASKLVAMVKSGQLIGSMPLKKKRSQRRAKQRAFLKAANKDSA